MSTEHGEASATRFVSFSSVRVGDCFRINVANIKPATYNNARMFDLLSSRASCELLVEDVKKGFFVSDSRLVLSCVSFRNRRKHLDHASFELSQGVYQYGHYGRKGGLLAALHPGFCHKCGRFADFCIHLLNRHHVCLSCYDRRAATAPFPYGEGAPWCCREKSCGERKLPFLDDGEGGAVLVRALEIYEEHKKACASAK